MKVLRVLLVALGGEAHVFSGRPARFGFWDMVKSGREHVTRDWFVASTGKVGGLGEGSV